MTYYLFLLFFLVIPPALTAQAGDSTLSSESYNEVVDSIFITGNEITEEYIILRELTFDINDSVNTEILDYNRDRIYSLGIFTRVNLHIRRTDDKNILFIVVEESWYIYPLPFVALRDRDWDKFSYGFTLLIRNFRGRNETLSGLFAFGYDPAFGLSYYRPSFIWKTDLFFNSGIIYQTINNRSGIAEYLNGESFEQKFVSGSAGIGYRFGLYQRADINFGFSYIETPFYIRGVSASGGRIDRLFTTGAGYSYDTRDLAQFPRNGIYALASIQFKGLGINNVNYQVYNIDFREYRELIGDLSGKWRMAGRFTSGPLIPFYDYSYLGFEERIRGHFSREREGHHSYIGSLELNYPFIKEMNINLDFVPLLPRELLHYRVAVYSQLFTDTGAIQFKNSSVSIKDFDTGYGVGLTFLFLPYNVFRLEFAMDEDFQESEFIFDLAVSF